jgi:predicted metal-dependent peptidase
VRTDLLDRLAAAKLWLISEAAPEAAHTPAPGPGGPPGLTYLAHALYALTPVLSQDVGTMTVDEYWRVYVDPGWLAAQEAPVVAAELAHVTWHLLLDHADRARDQHVDAGTASDWHQAADLTVRQVLDGATVRTDLPRPRGVPPGRSAEEYFALLSRLPPATGEAPDAGREAGPVPEGCGSGCDGLRRSYELPPDADVSEVDREEARQIRRRVAVEYVEHCTRSGTAPGDAWRWAKEILEPTVAWEPLLAGAVRRAAGWAHGHAEYTYTRPSRRAGAVRGVVLPSTRRPLPQVAMVIDTSGSVDDRLLGRALGEVDGALRALGVAGQAVSVISCDVAVSSPARVRRARDVRLAGGGGTDMRVGLQAASALRPRPDLVVVLTDGYTPWPAGPPPGAAVVVALLGRERRELPPTPTWATRVECLLE